MQLVQTVVWLHAAHHHPDCGSHRTCTHTVQRCPPGPVIVVRLFHPQAHRPRQVKVHLRWGQRVQSSYDQLAKSITRQGGGHCGNSVLHHSVNGATQKRAACMHALVVPLRRRRVRLVGRRRAGGVTSLAAAPSVCCSSRTKLLLRKYDRPPGRPRGEDGGVGSSRGSHGHLVLAHRDVVHRHA